MLEIFIMASSEIVEISNSLDSLLDKFIHAKVLSTIQRQGIFSH